MIDPKNVHATLSRHQLADGLSMVMDLEKSHGSWLRDAVSGEEYLDFFTCFASWPVGYNHPATLEPEFCSAIELTGRNKPASSDLYTTYMAEFVEAFATRVSPEGFDHHFWVSGGALAVENALKVAFDWKAQKVGVDLVNDGNDLVVLHFRQAFHGRSGYTLSVTNTVPDKIALFPKFDWPRVHNPAIEFDLEGNVCNDIEASEAQTWAEIEAACEKYKGRVAAILVEPLQGEGGDNHFRTEFFQKLRGYADSEEALLVFDEVQTGFFGSGKPWYWQYHGVRPDVVAFGKKSQICGIYAGPRVDEVADNVFVRSSRINSTWGGNLVDMVRSTKFIEIIEEENLADNVAARGQQLVSGLRSIARDQGHISNVRGQGSMVAFTLESPEQRDEYIRQMHARQLLVLASGEQAIRFRMSLVVTEAEIDQALERIADCSPAGV
ncbi:MAG: L-lysine 6-transaminase [Planctomycetes bacterium]|jgi:L-lysine 6-transaminase|nr:L-lysine 6-transaminase [Planctomycetota bacterium]MBV20825.1 L-lysine 6-transaminase [Planctomycetaceae bacterium]HJM56489.1 L-lysine 6-transaminase [Planctomycetota bacterium]